MYLFNSIDECGMVWWGGNYRNMILFAGASRANRVLNIIQHSMSWIDNMYIYIYIYIYISFCRVPHGIHSAKSGTCPPCAMIMLRPSSTESAISALPSLCQWHSKKIWFAECHFRNIRQKHNFCLPRQIKIIFSVLRSKLFLLTTYGTWNNNPCCH